MLILNFDRLTLLEQIAQMIVVRTSGHVFDAQLQYPKWEADRAQLDHLIKLGVGGVIFVGGSAVELATKIKQLQAKSAIPLFICADVEEGIGQRFAGATWFVPPMAFSAIEDSDMAEHLATAMGRITALEAQAIGLNWILAPTVDVNNNPANPVINVRAWGDNPHTVSRLACAFIAGAKQTHVLTCAKHFPGHGDTAIDSHLELPVITCDRYRLEQVELPSFRAAMAAGVDTVMSAHLQIPALDPVEPSTFSRPIITQLLRETLGFKGLIVTDALVMGAIADRYGPEEAAVRAVIAGADILMMPVDAESAINAIVQAVESGRLDRAQIQASLTRIQQAKLQVMSGTQKVSDVDPLATLGTIEHQQIAEQAIAASTKIFRSDITPKRLDRGRNLVLVDSQISSAILPRTAPALLLPTQMGLSELLIIDRHTPPIAWAEIPKLPTLVQIFLRGNPLRGTADLLKQVQTWLQYLRETEQLHSVAIYGSPYILEPLQAAWAPQEITWGFTYGQMPAAQAYLLGQLLKTPASLTRATKTLASNTGMF